MKTRSGSRLVAWLLIALLLTQSAATFSKTPAPAQPTTQPATQTLATTQIQATQLSRLKANLQYQQTRLDRLSLAIAARPSETESEPTATPTTAATQSELKDIAQNLGQLQSELDLFKQGVQPTASVPTEAIATTAEATTPVSPEATPRQLKVTDLGSVSGQANALYVPTDFEAIKAQADRLRAEVDRLVQLYDLSQASVEGEAGPGYTALIQGNAAKALAANLNAPHGWPVKGPITSPFGPRPTLIIPKTITTTVGQGGNPVTPTPVATIGLPDNIGQPTRRTTPVDDASTIGAGTTPAVTSTTTAAPTSTSGPTVTVTTTVTVAPTLTPATTASVTSTLTASPTPTTTTAASDPGPGYDSTGLVVSPGMEFHTGIDIGVPEGFEVHATADGVVEYAGDNRGGYGNVVYINHPGGFMTIYGHNSRLLVKAGQSVKAGDVIALSGSTGYSTGPHVHYEIRYNSQLCDPAPFLPLP